MFFKTSEVNPKLVLSANDRNIEDRWSAMYPQYLGGRLKENFYEIGHIQDKTRIGERTLPALGYDHVVKRPVIIKTCQYKADEIIDESLALKKREVLKSQIELLNDISSPLLPEPLDWFTVTNKVDGFISEKVINSEPVLVLGYIPGQTLNAAHDSNLFFRHQKTTDENGREVFKPIIPLKLNVTKLCLFISRIVDFLKVLHQNKYMVNCLAPEHILVLNNEIPRFVGLGRICKIKEDGTFDPEHINYQRTIKGYTAPELNSIETNFGENEDALSAAVYSLGIIMAQIICGDFNVYKETLKNSTIAYPNDMYQKKVLECCEKKGKSLDILLMRMCNPNPKTRLTDLNEIGLTLKEIGAILTEDERNELKRIRDERKEIKMKQTRDGQVIQFDLKSLNGVVKLLDTNEEIEITKEFLESCRLSYLIVGAGVSIVYEDTKDGSEKPIKMWVKKKEEWPKSLEKSKTEPQKDDTNELDEIFATTVVKTICTTAKVIYFDKKSGIGTVELDKNKKRLTITDELLSSCGLSFLYKNADINLTIECLKNGTQRPVRISLKKAAKNPVTTKPTATKDTNTTIQSTTSKVTDSTTKLTATKNTNTTTKPTADKKTNIKEISSDKGDDIITKPTADKDTDIITKPTADKVTNTTTKLTATKDTNTTTTKDADTTIDLGDVSIKEYTQAKLKQTAKEFIKKGKGFFNFLEEKIDA